MDILLLRHGIAVDAAEVGGDDEARTLTAEGRDRVKQAARAMRALGIRADLIWTSPLPRASETATLTAAALGIPANSVRTSDELKCGAAHLAFANLLRNTDDNAAVMFVGHNPDLERFASYLIAADGECAIMLKKGGLAIINLEDGKQSLKRPGGGTLITLFTQKDLCKLAP